MNRVNSRNGLSHDDSTVVIIIITIRYIYRPRSRGDNTFGSIRESVHLSVGALLFEPFDLDFWNEGRP